MSQGNRVQHPDLIGFLVVSAFLAVALAFIVTHFVPTGCSSSENEYAEAKKEAEETCRAPGHGMWVGQIKSPADEKACRREHREEADVRAQQRMAECAWEQARATQFGTWLLGLTLLAACWAAWEARKAAKATQETVDLTGTTAKKQLRAYITVERGNVVNLRENTSDIGKAPIIQVVFKNSGQTPAYDVIGIFTARIRKMPFSGELDYTSDAIQQRQGVIGPGGTFHVRLPIDNPSLSEEMKRDLRDGKDGLIIFGRIDYRDCFIKGQWLTFRLVYSGDVFSDPEGSLWTHEEGNDAS